MKKIIRYITIFIMMYSCNGQEQKGNIIYPKEKIMNTEKFDIKRFENYPDVVSMEEEKKLPSKKDVLPDGTIIEYSFWDNKEDGNKTYYTKTVTPPPPALFKQVRIFYPSGTIQRESEVFMGEINIEPFYNSLNIKDYDKEGYLIKTTDYSDFDKTLKIKFKDLLAILQKEPMVKDLNDAIKEKLYTSLFDKQIDKNKITEEKIIAELKSDDCNGKILNAQSDFERRNIKISLDHDTWMVTKDMYPRGFWEYKINANTGQVMVVDYQVDTRP